MKLSNVVAQLPKDAAIDKFRAELGALLKSKGDGSVSQECLEQIEIHLRSCIDRNFEFSTAVSLPLETAPSEGDISDEVDLPLGLTASVATKAIAP